MHQGHQNMGPRPEPTQMGQMGQMPRNNNVQKLNNMQFTNNPQKQSNEQYTKTYIINLQTCKIEIYKWTNELIITCKSIW